MLALLEHLERLLKPGGARRRRRYELDEDLHGRLQDLAEQEQRPRDEIAAELIVNGLKRRYTESDLQQRWETLSPREQDAAALACLGYTNRQIAGQLGIAEETVKTHLHNALVKFGLHGRAELRYLLSGWDFSAWEE